FSPVLWRSVGIGFTSGLIDSILALGLLPFLEGTFQLISSLKLLELGNPNHPLLRTLMMEAPGSYQHSIMVANLAEVVCDEIKANSLLARVGASFHDVGKTKRPIFFVENQHNRENPHDQLRPAVSAAILFAHVKDGLELGKEHKLPEQILQFIRSHHGTSEAGYFYRRAVAEAGEGEEVQMADFCYPGPKPPNKEVAVVMLADACEATVRTLQVPSEENITKTVERICRERLNNGQLDDCDLTIRDLNRVMATLTKTLMSVYHRRITYPAPEPSPSQTER
ncbi:MAG: HDIG domain-containing protein, partial [Symbiobacteriaceae bacterium]|nr:HDIG domain-containing protein [Symbiobacteriaceae bacterium]